MFSEQTQKWTYLEEYNLSPTAKDESQLSVLKRIAEQNEVMPLSWWDSVSLVVHNQSFTLIPSQFFKREFMPRYPHLARGTVLQADEETHYYFHQSTRAYNVFSAPKGIVEWLREQYTFNDLVVKPHSGLLIDRTLSKTQSGVSVWIDEGAFTMLYATPQGLQYCNRFVYQNTSDLVYYVLFVWQELGLKDTDLPLHIHGLASEQDETFVELSRFFEHTALQTGSQNAPLHRFAALMASIPSS